MKLLTKTRECRRCVFLILVLVWVSSSHAQTLSTNNWDQWNAISTPTFPGVSWQRYAVPEDAGWSSEKLAEARATSQSAGSAAVMIIFDGAILTQWGEVERRFNCHSIRKSLLSALYGSAVAAGVIDLNETIGSIGIEENAGLTPLEKSASVSDLLAARSGIYLPAILQTRSVDSVQPRRGSHEPGTHWYYNNWDFNALGTIYTRKTGNDLFEAFRSQIAVPLQMQDFELRHAHYRREPEKSQHPGYVFRMSARDLARFGILFLKNGRWGDAQIIPTDWVRESTKMRSITAAGGYGYMWWTEIGQLDELGTFAAYGYGGHAIYIVPAAKLVMVHRADTYAYKNVSYDAMRKVLRQTLNARTGPPRANPKLETVSTSDLAQPEAVLTQAQMTPLVGRYNRDGLVLVIRQIDDQLEVESPRQGRFFLRPLSQTEFRTEDSGWHLSFTLDEAGRSTLMRIWLAFRDDPYEFVRLP